MGGPVGGSVGGIIVGGKRHWCLSTNWGCRRQVLVVRGAVTGADISGKVTGAGASTCTCRDPPHPHADLTVF
jgi:hypothetical protein